MHLNLKDLGLSGALGHLKDIRRGLEKESLRVDLNGNISKSVAGTLSKVIINGRWNSEFEESLKKVISSNNVRINVNEKKIRVSKKVFFKNNLIKYLSNVFIMISLLLIKICKL